MEKYYASNLTKEKADEICQAVSVLDPRVKWGGKQRKFWTEEQPGKCGLFAVVFEDDKIQESDESEDTFTIFEPTLEHDDYLDGYDEYGRKRVS